MGNQKKAGRPDPALQLWTLPLRLQDRKSTRLYSSHLGISFGPFAGHDALPISKARTRQSLNINGQSEESRTTGSCVTTLDSSSSTTTARRQRSSCECLDRGMGSPFLHPTARRSNSHFRFSDLLRLKIPIHKLSRISAPGVGHDYDEKQCQYV